MNKTKSSKHLYIFKVPSCAWVIKLQDTRKVIELWFDYFEQEETNSTCDQRDSLIIFDSTTKPIDMLGDMCRDGEVSFFSINAYNVYT